MTESKKKKTLLINFVSPRVFIIIRTKRDTRCLKFVRPSLYLSSQKWCENATEMKQHLHTSFVSITA